MQRYKLDLDKVKELALCKGWSLSKLCEKAGMSRSRVSDWKSRGINPNTAYRLANALSVEPTEIIIKDGDDDAED